MTDNDGGPRGSGRGDDLPAPRPGYYPAPARPPGPGRRRAAPSPAQSSLMTRIAAGRRARQRRALLSVCGAMSAVVMAVAGGAWGLTSYVNGNVGRVNAGTAGAPSRGSLNVLLAGVDLRTGLTRAQQRELHVGHSVSFNSDTMMLIHLSADRSRVTIVSLPRDSWVSIPGHGMNKINAAFGLGGPQLMVSTVERNTGLPVNNFIEVNFLGFVKVINALGGVNVCLPFAVNDPNTGLRLSAGRHHVNGVTALKFARDRHSFATSDLARISNQQQLLSSLLGEAISSGTLADPFKLTRFLQAVLPAVKVDQGLNLAALADQLRGITPSDVRFMTVPLGNTNYLTPTGESAVLWNAQAARQLFASLRNDTAPPKRPKHAGGTAHSLRRSQVSVDVYNGTLIGGLSAGTGAELTRLGFRVTAGLTWTRQDIAQTVIEYPAGHLAAARLVRTALHGATLRQVSGLSKIRVILGTAGHAVTVPAASSGSGSAPAGSKTAAQDACR